MDNFVKTVREQLKITQEQFAKMLGVSVITVNRWENGKAIPSILAQNGLYEISKKHEINPMREIKEQKEGTVLYHASRTGISGNIIPCSRTKCDFGSGFYMGTQMLQPLTLVCNESHPIMYELQIDDKNLKTLNVEVGLDWAMLIAYYRGYMAGFEDTEIYKKYANMTKGYDLVTGFIADDRMYQVLTDFFEERITDRALVACLSALDLGKQYVALTQKACDAITIKDQHRLNMIELLWLRDISIIRRNQGVLVVESILKQYRRTGIYFDEIITGKNIKEER